MKIYGDYHTHTTFSHGSGSIRDNVNWALQRGLKEVAICDHGPGHYLYGVKKEKLPLMREEIDRLNKEYNKKGIKILLGVEANLIGLDGSIDMDEELIQLTDILLLGYHYGAMPKSIIDGIGLYVRNPLTKLVPLGRQKTVDMNTDALIRAINKYPINFITHPGSKAKVDIKRLAREAGKIGTALEINAKHSQLSVESIQLALEEDVEFIINSDAHRPEDVGNVEESFKRAKLAGVPLNRIKNII